jgi:hypothetical protein
MKSCVAGLKVRSFTGLGLAPDDLLQDYSKAMEAASAESGRARFDEARRHVRLRTNVKFGKILALDVARKKEILAAIKERASQDPRRVDIFG